MGEVDLKHGFDNIKRLIKNEYKNWKEERRWIQLMKSFQMMKTIL
jgi:hypothetical protein